MKLFSATFSPCSCKLVSTCAIDIASSSSFSEASLSDSCFSSDLELSPPADLGSGFFSCSSDLGFDRLEWSSWLGLSSLLSCDISLPRPRTAMSLWGDMLASSRWRSITLEFRWDPGLISVKSRGGGGGNFLLLGDLMSEVGDLRVCPFIGWKWSDRSGLTYIISLPGLRIPRCWSAVGGELYLGRALATFSRGVYVKTFCGGREGLRGCISVPKPCAWWGTAESSWLTFESQFLVEEQNCLFDISMARRNASSFLFNTCLVTLHNRMGVGMMTRLCNSH